ncbi:MAG: hypothetical protein ACAI25_13595 [Planctomycetota bacterium]
MNEFRPLAEKLAKVSVGLAGLAAIVLLGAWLHPTWVLRINLPFHHLHAADYKRIVATCAVLAAAGVGAAVFALRNLGRENRRFLLAAIVANVVVAALSLAAVPCFKEPPIIRTAPRVARST